MPKPIPVFYSPKMVADSRCISPSAAKPIKVVESWQRQFDVELHEPDPVTVEDLCRAHDRDFVEDTLACRIANGFGNESPEVAASLPYTSGAMLSAARHAIRTKGAAAAPCSGFHHAGYMSSEGFCTFNGLMVAAMALKEEGLVQRVGILDLDMHYGNGTDSILRVRQAGSWVRHFTGGAEFHYASQATYFFSTRLAEALASMAGCDVVLYQAGADPHVDDPYGGWLTTEQLRQRDSIVFDTLKSMGIPVAWNLAGGYQVEPDGSIPKVLEIHDNTMRECSRVHG